MDLKKNTLILISMKKIETIIIRMPNWLGDCIMATPVIQDVRAHFPEAKITLMCKEGMESLFLGNPAVNEIFTFTRPNTFLHRLEHHDVIERLRQGHWDLGILLPNSFTSAWWFFRGNVKQRLGFRANGRTLLLTKSLSFPKERGKEHLVNTYKRILAPLDIPLSATTPELFVLEKEREAIEQLLTQYQIPKGSKIVGLNPTAAYGPAKCWPKERYHELAHRLIQEDPYCYVLVFGDLASADLCNHVASGLGTRGVNLAGRTSLRELISFIKRVDLFITNDSGPMHMAAALKTPLIAIFGSTSDVATGPYQHGVVIHKHVSCSPCFKRVCPIDFRCMTRISVDEVYREARKILVK
jgi:heptosyltransferase-2